MTETSAIPLISILCATYNHVRYIEQALQSFIMQQTDFPFEVVLGDDGSNDGTTEICRRYAERYPEIIRHQLRDRTTSLAFGFPGKYNSVNLFREGRGKYIAICDGDDFYSNPRALQLQADFLEAHPDYGMVYGGADILQQESGKVISFRGGCFSPAGSIYDELFIWNFIKTCTVCIRRPCLDEFMREMIKPEFKFRFCDYFIWLSVASQSKVGYIDERLGTYRVHSSSVMNVRGMKNDLICAKEKYRILCYYLAHYGGPYSRDELQLFYLRKAVSILHDHGCSGLASRYSRLYQRRLRRWHEAESLFMAAESVWLI